LTLIATSVAACYTRKQWLTADDQERRSLRAYVFVEGSFFEQNAESATFKISIKNSGQTPAYKVRYWTKIGLMDYPLPEDKFPAAPDPSEVKFIGVVAPQGTYEMNVTRLFIYQGEERESLAPNKALYVAGRIDYEDAFLRNCWTTFRYFVGGENNLARPLSERNAHRTSSYRSGNDADRDCTPQ
jgi:hypothetical protein